jgi:uncharacterized OB-fold protein
VRRLLHGCSSPHGLFEFINFFTPEGAWVSLARTGDGVRVEDPGKINEIVETIRQQIGESIFTSGSFHASLEPAEALVLGALWDLTRKATLRAIPDDKDSGTPAWPVSSILAQASEKDEKYQWMTNVIRTWTDFGGDLSEAEVKTAAGNLVAKNYCSEQAGSYVLTGDALDFSRNMLLVSTIVTLTSGIEGPDGKVAVVGFSAIQAGVHDLLMIDFEGGKLELDSVSAAEVTEYIDAFMRKPQDLLKPYTPKPEVKKEHELKCPKCGAPLIASQKFCGSCGAPAENSTTGGGSPLVTYTCPKCGKPVIPGKKFCSNCGAPVTVPAGVPDSTPAIPTCQNCGNPLTPGKKFCSNCGIPVTVPAGVPDSTPIVPTCPKCGNPLTPGKKFCGFCGAKTGS